jgi:mono/diheme cytochrome c family protein
VLPGDPANGKFVYTGACTVCRGASGKGGTHGGAPLTNVLTRGAIVIALTNGCNQMPAFGSSMPAQEREDVAAYVLQLVK